MTVIRSTFATLLALFLVAHLFSTASSQQVRNQTLFNALKITILPPSPALFTIFPQNIILAETPVVVRYALFTSLASYQIFAACHPTALNFFGVKDAVDNKLCDPLSRLITTYQLIYLLLRKEFPLEAAGIARFMLGFGINPFDVNAAIDSPIGWANANAPPIVDYFTKDGWNSLGDVTKKFYKFPFQDSTGYKPQNSPLDSPQELSRPLRWQPLVFTDRRGRFGYQIHVTPHIGIKVKPLVLTMEDFESRKAPSPYQFPNSVNEIKSSDEKKMRQLLDKLFSQTRTLTDDRVTLAYWWENKLISLGPFLSYYSQKLKLDETFRVAGLFGEMLAQHDAVLIAWKEKRRHDLVRPSTMVKRFMSGEMVNTYLGVGLGIGMMPVEQWEPIVPVQPHSEFPSGSAIICTATLERLKFDIENAVGTNITLPPFELQGPSGSVPRSPVMKSVKIRFETLEEAIKSCGESRLYGGIHFEPSVTASNDLAKGIGKAVFEHVADLVAGRVPKNCLRCIK